MSEKEIWRDEDFEGMGWHDCRLYSVSFPNESHEIKLDIDYIFHISRSTSEYYTISPCDLIFDNVGNMAANIDTSNLMQSYILSIERSFLEHTKIGNHKLWKFNISGDFGSIVLQATGFRMLLRTQPIRSKEGDLWTWRMKAR